MNLSSLLAPLLAGFVLIVGGGSEARALPLNEMTNVVFRLYKGAVIGAVTNVEEGAFGYDSSDHSLRYYDGSNWRTLLQTDGSAMGLEGFGAASVTAGVNNVTVELPLVAEYTPSPSGYGTNVHISGSMSIATALLWNTEYKVNEDLAGTLAEPSVVRLRGLTLAIPSHVSDYSPIVYRAVAGPDEFRYVNPISFFAMFETDPLWSAVSGTVTTAVSDLATATNDLNSRVETLEANPGAAWATLAPMASVMTGLEPAYSAANVVQFGDGALYGVDGKVYKIASYRNYTITPPGASEFVYLFADASASAEGADGLQVTQSSTGPARNSLGQWVSQDDTDDRYLGCVLWLTDSPAGMAKFQYSNGAYELSDARLFPAAATGISSWHAKVVLGTQQAMTGAWVAPETDASDLLPNTACAALVGGVWSFYNSGSAPGAIGYAVASSETASDSYGTGIFLTADRENAVWDMPIGGFAGRGGGPSGGAHIHGYLLGANETGSAPADLRTTVARTGWVQLGASRNMRIAADDSNLGAPVADWAILGWKEAR